jgi:hypothetical protein
VVAANNHVHSSTLPQSFLVEDEPNAQNPCSARVLWVCFDRLSSRSLSRGDMTLKEQRPSLCGTLLRPRTPRLKVSVRYRYSTSHPPSHPPLRNLSSDTLDFTRRNTYHLLSSYSTRLDHRQITVNGITHHVRRRSSRARRPSRDRALVHPSCGREECREGGGEESTIGPPRCR